MRARTILAAVSPSFALTACGSSTKVNNPNGFEGTHMVLAWNDLGMHCLNPTYDQAVVLPPFNTVWAQVIRLGDPPEIVTSGITITYSIEDNTYSYGKRDYGQFWDYAVALFGPLLGITGLPHDEGLAGEGLSGEMALAGDHGGTSPEVRMSCHVCHTAVSTDYARWPHAYQWTNTN